MSRRSEPPTAAQRSELAMLARRTNRRITAPKTRERAARLIGQLRKADKERQPPHRRKAGATKTRLTYTAAPNAAIREKQRAARKPQPVTIRHVEPDPRPRTVKHRDAPPTPRQRKLLKTLCRRAGIDVPYVSNRGEAADAIDRLTKDSPQASARRP